MQWNRLHWKEEHCVVGGIALRLDDEGNIASSHDLKFAKHPLQQLPAHAHIDAEGFHDLDFSPPDIKEVPEMEEVEVFDAKRQPGRMIKVMRPTGRMIPVRHLGDGLVDHITLHPVMRGENVSVHAIYRDNMGNSTGRKDAHYQCA